MIIAFYEHAYDDMNMFYDNILEENLSLAEKVLKEYYYNFIGIVDRKPPRSKRKSVEKLLNSLQLEVVHTDWDKEWDLRMKNYLFHKEQPDAWVGCVSACMTPDMIFPGNWTKEDWVENKKLIDKKRSLNARKYRRLKNNWRTS